ncbi:MAG: LysR family transcriptional regulator [Pseudomonadota bacterium]
MRSVTHLKSLQALDLAIRAGSLKAAAEMLGITPAAIGQRIRALEDYLGADLLLRGRSGLTPTPELTSVLDDLRQAFDALERVTGALDFQRTSEIHIVADPDWAELWLMPRLSAFRSAYPNILFCVNGIGDVSVRLGQPDLRVVYDDGPGEPLFRDVLVPVTGLDNIRRMKDEDPARQMEGMPLLHLKAQFDRTDHPGWVQWFDRFGHRITGPARGVHYANARLAIEAVRQDVGFLVCGLSLLLKDLQAGTVALPFPGSEHLVMPHPYTLRPRADAEKRPQLQRFVAWLRKEAEDTRRQINEMSGQKAPRPSDVV